MATTLPKYKQLKVSIITATYNSASNISTAINSLNTQSCFDIEWVVIDGASKDDTVKIIKDTFSGNLQMTSENDKGIYDALNKGIKKATGDIIGFLHSDDLLASSDILNEVVNIFQHNDVDGVYGDLQYVAKDNTSKVIRYWKSQNFTPSLLMRGWMPAHPTLFLKREVYQKHGLFNLKFKIAADYDLMLRIFSDNSLRFHYLPQVITKMRVGGASNRSLRNIQRKSLEDLQALKSNSIPNPYLVLARKNFSKVGQFVKK